MSQLDLRQPEIAAIEDTFEPGETSDFPVDASEVVFELQEDPYNDDLTVIAGLAKIAVSPLEIRYEVPTSASETTHRLAWTNNLLEVNSANELWGLTSIINTERRTHGSRAWISSRAILELMQAEEVPTFDELADEEAKAELVPDPLLDIWVAPELLEELRIYPN